MDEDEYPEGEERGDETIYSEEGREAMVEDDQIEPWEEGFMEGADMDGQHAKCRKCGAKITPANTIEKEFKGELMWFCSEECLEKYEEEHPEE